MEITTFTASQEKRSFFLWLQKVILWDFSPQCCFLPVFRRLHYFPSEDLLICFLTGGDEKGFGGENLRMIIWNLRNNEQEVVEVPFDQTFSFSSDRQIYCGMTGIEPIIRVKHYDKIFEKKLSEEEQRFLKEEGSYLLKYSEDLCYLGGALLDEQKMEEEESLLALEEYLHISQRVYIWKVNKI